jgi:hypothetical protein
VRNGDSSNLEVQRARLQPERLQAVKNIRRFFVEGRNGGVAEGFDGALKSEPRTERFFHFLHLVRSERSKPAQEFRARNAL